MFYDRLVQICTENKISVSKLLINLNMAKSNLGIDRPDRWLNKMRKEYPDIFPHKDLHTLRHTFATYLLNDHVDIATVSGALGHAQKTTTLNIYSHVIEKTKKAAIQGQESRILSLKKDDTQ